MTEQDEKIAELLAELDACADANDPEDIFQRAIDTIKSEREKRRKLNTRLAAAWAELLEIRVAIDADPEEATVDEVRRVVSELKRERENENDE